MNLQLDSVLMETSVVHLSLFLSLFQKNLMTICTGPGSVSLIKRKKIATSEIQISSTAVNKVYISTHLRLKSTCCPPLDG